MSRNVALIRPLEHAQKKALDFAGRDMLQLRELERGFGDQTDYLIAKPALLSIFKRSSRRFASRKCEK
jgi:hypothetical protein